MRRFLPRDVGTNRDVEKFEPVPDTVRSSRKISGPREIRQLLPRVIPERCAHFNPMRRIAMKFFNTFRPFAIIQALLMSASAFSVYAADVPVDVGKGEYDSACAVCHGLDGKGDGYMATQLTVRVPDLTLLAKHNKGIFPFDRVYQVIDGRQEVKAHGTREMPIWGRAFNRQTSIYFENYPPQDTESAARSRILALTEYLYRLQGK
jgi:hypothetical protein